jgi:hypothetical protein
MNPDQPVIGQPVDDTLHRPGAAPEQHLELIQPCSVLLTEPAEHLEIAWAQ